jgi:hypothetical protein
VDLYPPGAYPKNVDRHGVVTLFWHWLEKIDAAALALVSDDVDQLALEIFPQSAQQTLEEWEAALEIDNSSDTEALRQEAVTAASRAALLLTPRNLRAALFELLNSQYGFWDPGTADVLAHYDGRGEDGNGARSEGATGVIISGTAPAQCDYPANPPVLEHYIVDRNDTFVFEAELQAHTTNQDTASCIHIRDSIDNVITLGVEDIAGAGVRVHARRIQDGTWSNLGDIAVPSLPAFFKIEKDSAGLLQLTAGGTSVAADVEIAWTPRLWGLHGRNLSTWRTFSGRWQDIRIAYGNPVNNVELHEQRADTIPADSPDCIFRAFVHRDPDDAGDYDIVKAQQIVNRLTWGHTIITVGESDNFLTDDPSSLTDRDILGI